MYLCRVIQFCVEDSRTAALGKHWMGTREKVALAAALRTLRCALWKFYSEGLGLALALVSLCTARSFVALPQASVLSPRVSAMVCLATQHFSMRAQVLHIVSVFVLASFVHVSDSQRRPQHCGGGRRLSSAVAPICLIRPCV